MLSTRSWRPPDGWLRRYLTSPFFPALLLLEAFLLQPLQPLDAFEGGRLPLPFLVVSGTVLTSEKSPRITVSTWAPPLIGNSDLAGNATCGPRVRPASQRAGRGRAGEQSELVPRQATLIW